MQAHVHMLATRQGRTVPDNRRATDVNNEAIHDNSALQGAHVVRPLTVAKYPPRILHLYGRRYPCSPSDSSYLAESRVPKANYRRGGSRRHTTERPYPPPVGCSVVWARAIHRGCRHSAVRTASGTGCCDATTHRVPSLSRGLPRTGGGGTRNGIRSDEDRVWVAAEGCTARVADRIGEGIPWVARNPDKFDVSADFIGPYQVGEYRTQG